MLLFNQSATGSNYRNFAADPLETHVHRDIARRAEIALGEKNRIALPMAGSRRKGLFTGLAMSLS